MSFAFAVAVVFVEVATLLTCLAQQSQFSTNMYIDNLASSEHTMVVTSSISNIDHNISATFTALYNPCNNPSLTVVYYEIDYDSNYEYFNVYRNNMSLITQCGTRQCGGYWSTCINDYLLTDVTQIPAGDSYTVHFTVSNAVSNVLFCSSYSLFANLTLTCTPYVSIHICVNTMI